VVETAVSVEILPLFPLQVVLFPEARLPLHIFEERYKTLVSECVGTEKEFGINLATGSKLAGVGCTAVVVAVLKVYDDGKMDIVVEGRRRYRLLSSESGKAPYLVGQVEFFTSSPEEPDRDLIERTIRLYNELVSVVYRDTVERIDKDATGPEISFLIGQKAGMGLEQRQQLLELTSENQRLQLLHDYLEAVLPKLEQAGEIEKIIRSDGYLPRSKATEDE
jgi:ATP-dependent Lon protease